MTNHTSLPLSKKLAEGGCKIKSEFLRKDIVGGKLIKVENLTHQGNTNFYPAYDLLWDICIKHAKEFFGQEKICDFCETLDVEDSHKDCCDAGYETTTNMHYSKMTFQLLQQNKIQKAEDYIWEHCKFNPKNK